MASLIHGLRTEGNSDPPNRDDDALAVPAFLRLSAEERTAAWGRNPPKPMPAFGRELTETERLYRASIERDRARKRAIDEARFAELRARQGRQSRTRGRGRSSQKEEVMRDRLRWEAEQWEAEQAERLRKLQAHKREAAGQQKETAGRPNVPSGAPSSGKRHRRRRSPDSEA
jgi:hypothetical protein